MKKLAFLFSICSILILSSCGTSKIRYAKVKSNHEASVKPKAKKSNREIESLELQTVAEIKERPSSNVIDPLEQSVIISINPVTDTSKLEVKKLVDTDPRKEQKLTEARRAAGKAKNSKVFSALGLLSILQPLIGFPFFIVGLVNFSAASKARYITVEGERNRKKALIFIIIDSVILLIYLALLILFIALAF